MALANISVYSRLKTDNTPAETRTSPRPSIARADV